MAFLGLCCLFFFSCKGQLGEKIPLNMEDTEENREKERAVEAVSQNL